MTVVSEIFSLKKKNKKDGHTSIEKTVPSLKQFNRVTDASTSQQQQKNDL